MKDNALYMRFCQNGRIAPDNDTIIIRGTKLIPYALLFPRKEGEREGRD